MSESDEGPSGAHGDDDEADDDEGDDEPKARAKPARAEAAPVSARTSHTDDDDDDDDDDDFKDPACPLSVDDVNLARCSGMVTIFRIWRWSAIGLRRKRDPTCSPRVVVLSRIPRIFLEQSMEEPYLEKAIKGCFVRSVTRPLTHGRL
jgi:hypothetical protein